MQRPRPVVDDGALAPGIDQRCGIPEEEGDDEAEEEGDMHGEDEGEVECKGEVYTIIPQVIARGQFSLSLALSLSLSLFVSHHVLE